MDKIVRDIIVKDKTVEDSSEVQWRISIELKINELIEGYSNIWENIQDIQGKLAVMRTVVDDMVEKGE